MTIVLAGRDKAYLHDLRDLLTELCPGGNLVAFTDPMYVIKYSLEHPIDIVFAEVEAHPLDGLTLSRMLKERFPGLCTVLMADSDQYRVHAMQSGADGYLNFPLDKASVSDILEQVGLHER